MHVKRILATAAAAAALLSAPGATTTAAAAGDATVFSIVGGGFNIQSVGGCDLVGYCYATWHYDNGLCTVAGASAQGLCSLSLAGTLAFYNACDTGTMSFSSGNIVETGPFSATVLLSNLAGSIQLVGGAGVLSASAVDTAGRTVTIAGVLHLTTTSGNPVPVCWAEQQVEGALVATT